MIWTRSPGADSLEQFAALREELGLLGRAMAMLEAVERLALERSPTPELHEMLLRGLRSLTSHPSALSVGAFLWRLAQLEGVAPGVDRCVHCGENQNLVALDIANGGLNCRACRRGATTPVDAETVTVLQEILGGRVATALARPSSRTTSAVERLAVAVLEQPHRAAPACAAADGRRGRATPPRPQRRAGSRAAGVTALPGPGGRAA